MVSVPGLTANHDSEWFALNGPLPQLPGTGAFPTSGYPPPVVGWLTTAFVAVIDECQRLFVLTTTRFLNRIPPLSPRWQPETALALSAILDVNRLSFGKQGPNFAQVGRARAGKAGRTRRT